MSNAIRHGEPTRVDIAIAHDDADGIRVEVTDDGIGMAADGTTAARLHAARPDRHARAGDGDGRFAVDRTWAQRAEGSRSWFAAVPECRCNHSDADAPE